MKKLIYVLFLFLGVAARGQKNQNVEDLDFLYQALEKTPSFKKLKKGDKNYQQLYDEIKQKIAEADEKETFKQLSRLIIAINDNHLAFYRTPDTTLKVPYLSLSINPDSLQKELSLKQNNVLEGIYYLNGREFGLYANKSGTYYMASLANNILIGEFFITNYGGFDMIWYAVKPVPYSLIKNVRLVNGTLIGTPFTKHKEKQFSSLSKGLENYEYKTLSDEVGYLRLSSFSSSNANVKKSEEFYAAIVDRLSATNNLIVDLRNNGGGGYRTSGKFIKLLKKYKGNIYILQNSATVSNAEQFILALKPLENVITLGEQTKGMLTFGSNYGKKLILPSGRFTFYPTDMRGLDREYFYESRGIDPEVSLDLFKGDWVTQTLEYINSKK